MKFNFLSLFFLFITSSSIAQTSPQLNAAELLLAIKKLGVTGSVLYIAAHPDDENTRLLAYLAKEKLYKTGYLALTRGDGGQNLIGNEQAEDLGLIRTQELLAARRNDSAIQFFTRANDFGFSKTPEETFKIWNKDSILSDVVYIIRKFKPDVIITRFPPDARAGHGHHAASSILAQEAFTAAADPNMFPAQLKEVSVWQAKRILWNNYNFGGNDNTADDQLKIDVGVYNNLLGKSYGEIAAESRSMHKSQGFGSARQRGSSLEYFSSWKGALPKSDLMEGINTDWSKIKGAENVDGLVTAVVESFNPQQPQKSITQLLIIYKVLAKAQKTDLVNEKLNELKNIILACSGTWFEAYAIAAFNAVNTPYNVKVDLISQSPDVSITVKNWDKKVALQPNKLTTVEGEKTSANISQPYWLAEAHDIGRYHLASQNLLNYPEGKPADSINFSVNINGVNLDFQRSIVYKYTDAVRGEVYQPLAITPPVTATISTKAFVFNEEKQKSITVKLKAFQKNAQGTLTLQAPKGWKISPNKLDFDLKDKDEEKSLAFTLLPLPNAENGLLKATVLIAGKTYDNGIKTISYEHIPTITYFPPAEAKLVKLDLKSTAKNIGYIVGAGDLIPEALREIGLNVTVLSENDLANNNLSNYDAIIAGVRLYNVNERMKFVQKKLMDYVKNGGVYLVQYNVNRPLVMDNIGPYPFTIVRDRVTEENATVNFINPQSKALNFPNKITTADFDGWIQERGIYFASEASKEYEKPLSMKDTGEKESEGSLLIANYGKGKFVYTGLVFFRELPAGVPGAYRLFMNLLAK
ncbi:PIG-L family deacetylase [Pedobacter arcticus]|uniref:PIG-L family deacetylase n=1 Tax=Pedobacter arcticus TaxID=752140 RepID=UPI0002FA23BB|nr:PIG-L family deacetylase [Pedobacter arcticus]